jgi:PAS domain S-box-containing protein
MWLSAGTALMLLVLSTYIWRRRSISGAIPLMVGCLFAAVWAFGSVMEIAAVDLTTKVRWSMLQAFTQIPIVITVTAFILEYAWPGRWLNRRNILLQTIVPAAFAFLAATNHFHHLAWSSFHLNSYGSIEQQFGPVCLFLLLIYFPVYEVINLVVLGWLLWRSPQHRWPVIIMLAGQLTGRGLYVLVKMGILSFAVPLGLFGMGIEFLTYAVVLFSFRILDPFSIARNVAIDQMCAGMVVLSSQGRITNLNPAAENILGTTTKAAEGKLIRDLLPVYLVGQLKDPVQIEFDMKKGETARTYTLAISNLMDWRGLEMGQLWLLNDVTERKRDQAQIVEQQRALAILKERERLARELHDGIGQTLGYVKMQAQSARDRLAQGLTAETDHQLTLLIAAAQDAHTDVREYLLEVQTSATGQPGFLTGLKQYLHRFGEVYELNVGLVVPPDWSDDLLEPTVEAQLLRIIQEALTNVRKHARATCVQVLVRLNGPLVQIIVQDDGIGFDPTQVQDRSDLNYGLGFLRERAMEVGGSVYIHSARGQGTQVIVEVPRRFR